MNTLVAVVMARFPALILTDIECLIGMSLVQFNQRKHAIVDTGIRLQSRRRFHLLDNDIFAALSSDDTYDLSTILSMFAVKENLQ